VAAAVQWMIDNIVVMFHNSKRQNFRRPKPSDISPKPSEIAYVRQLKAYVRRHLSFGRNGSKIRLFLMAAVENSLCPTAAKGHRH
jgi:hypothetical protein